MWLSNLVRNKNVEIVLQTKKFFDFLETCIQEHSHGLSHCFSAEAKVYLNTAHIDIAITPPTPSPTLYFPYKCIVKVKALKDGSIHFFEEKGDMKILEGKTFMPKK